ncbi:MAG: NACHT domain-containing protein [Saprospiraceae bacterium]
MAKKSDPTRVSVDGRYNFSKVVRRLNDTTALLGGDVGFTVNSFAKILDEKADSAEAQAYTLLWTAQKNTVRRILKHHFQDDDYISQEPDIQSFILSKSYFQALWDELPNLDIYIDRDFISTPTNHHSTNKLHQFFTDWATKELNLNEKGARVLTAAFPRLLLSELAKLDKREFAQLYTAFDSPFLDAEEKAQKLDAYQAQLIQEYDRPAFGNPAVRLDDVFIASRFEYFRPKAKEGVAQRKDDFYPPDTPLPLIDLVTKWLGGKLPNDCPSQSPNLFLLLGQPGQGKSTFCNRLLFDLITDNQGLAKNVFFVRLRDLEPNDGFLQQPIQTVLDYLNKYEFRKSILNFEDLDKSLLVLDGFDEYSMNHSLSQEEADNLIERLSSEILQHSKGGAPLNIKCLLSSRTNYIRREKHKKNNDLLIVHLSEMNLSEQQKWVEKYSRSLEKTVYEEVELNQKKAF